MKNKYEIFFCFQAEDGIRGKLVTGVQTCALPISAHRAEPMPFCPMRRPTLTAGIVRTYGRSEERRVGKECRSRWWPCHRKEKHERRQFVLGTGRANHQPGLAIRLARAC